MPSPLTSLQMQFGMDEQGEGRLNNRCKSKAMKPKILLLATIDGIIAEGDFDQPDQIYEFLAFSNNPHFVVEQMTDKKEHFLKSCGEINFKLILGSNAIVFFQITFQDIQVLNAFLKESHPTVLMEAFGNRLKTFVEFLWLVKDSCASVGNIYCIFHHGVATCNPNNYCSSCKGDIKSVTFQRSEIKSAITLFGKYRTSLKTQKLPTQHGLKLTDDFPSVFSNSKSRLSKTLLMLQVVRKTEDIGLKIAHYCSCFEILFNSPTDTEGIAHKLAERISFFLFTSSVERVTAYDVIREAYRVRCEIFHGKFVGPKRQEILEQTSIKCDDLLRKILNRILESAENAALFSDKGDVFDQHFKDLILGTYQM